MFYYKQQTKKIFMNIPQHFIDNGKNTLKVQTVKFKTPNNKAERETAKQKVSISIAFSSL